MPTIEFYELVKRQIEEPKAGEFRIATAAVWTCAMCREIIDGMGGPGNGELCLDCGEDIIAGHFKVGRKVKE